MAITTLALVYSTVTGRVTHSGITSNAMPATMARTLSALGIIFEPGAYEGWLACKTGFDAKKRARIIAGFNKKFGHPLNPEMTEADSTAVVNETDFEAADTTLTVDDGTQVAALDYIRIDNEILQIDKIATHNLTVRRGLDGTVDATHLKDAAVYIVATFALTITSV